MQSRRQILFAASALVGCHSARRLDMPIATPSASAANSCAIRRLSEADAEQIEVEISSAAEFPVQNELPVLRIGSIESRLSRYPEGGDTQALIFTFSFADFTTIPDGADVILYYGELEDPRRRSCGKLDKRRL